MAADRVERKLAAILAADVAGYSRLMGVDEEGTLARLTAHRRELALHPVGCQFRLPEIAPDHSRVAVGSKAAFAAPLTAAGPGAG